MTDGFSKSRRDTPRGYPTIEKAAQALARYTEVTYNAPDAEAAVSDPGLAPVVEALFDRRIAIGPAAAKVFLWIKRRGLGGDGTPSEVSEHLPTPGSPSEAAETASGGAEEASDAHACTEEEEEEEEELGQRDLLHTLMAARVPVYVHGEAGGGKSRAVEDTAGALGYVFRRGVALRSRSDLCGGISAGGAVRSQFHALCDEAACDPGRTYVYCIDELDRCDPSVAVCLNPVLSDRTLPVPGGSRDVPPNVYVVATGNTDLTGSDPDYWSQPMDASVRDRFVPVEWTSEPDLCRRILGGLADRAVAAGMSLTPRRCARLRSLVDAGVPFGQAVRLAAGV